MLRQSKLLRDDSILMGSARLYLRAILPKLCVRYGVKLEVVAGAFRVAPRSTAKENKKKKREGQRP